MWRWANINTTLTHGEWWRVLARSCPNVWLDVILTNKMTMPNHLITWIFPYYLNASSHPPSLSPSLLCFRYFLYFSFWLCYRFPIYFFPSSLSFLPTLLCPHSRPITLPFLRLYFSHHSTVSPYTFLHVLFPCISFFVTTPLLLHEHLFLPPFFFLNSYIISAIRTRPTLYWPTRNKKFQLVIL